MAAETDVGEPRTASVGREHDQGEMVKRRPEVAVSVHPCGYPSHPSSERFKQKREQAVELVTKPAAIAPDDLLDQIILGQRDRLAQVDAQVLERDCLLMGAVQAPQPGRVSRRPSRPDPLQISLGGLAIHLCTSGL